MIKKSLMLLLEKSNLPLSVQDILKTIRANKTTIYRELENFIKEGLVKEIEFGDGKKRYESTKMKHHHHVICKNCGKIKNININEKLILADLNEKDFKIESHSIEFFGLCSSCH